METERENENNMDMCGLVVSSVFSTMFLMHMRAEDVSGRILYCTADCESVFVWRRERAGARGFIYQSLW